MMQTGDGVAGEEGELARQRMFEDPAVAPAAVIDYVRERLGRCTLTLPDIVSMQKNVRCAIDRGYAGGRSVVTEERAMTPAKKEEQKPEQSFPPSTKAEREEYLRAWAMQQRHPVTREAKAELKRKFGIGIGTDDYNKILREVDRKKREVEAGAPTIAAPAVSIPIQTQVRKPSLEEVAYLGRALASYGVCNLKVARDGSVLAFECFQ